MYERHEILKNTILTSKNAFKENKQLVKLDKKYFKIIKKIQGG